MKKLLIGVLLFLAWGQAWGQVPSGPFVNASSLGNQGVVGGVGVWAANIANPGTGYVPGDTFTSVIAGAQTNSLLSYLTNAIFYITNTQVVSATVAAGGSGCTNGASQTMTGTTGIGTVFQALVTVSGNAVTAVNSISVPGVYNINPTSLTNEPITGASCTGAQLNLVMGALNASIQNPGSYSSVPGGSAVATQSATSGSGVGATFTVLFATQAAYVIPPNQAGGGGNNAAIENWFSGFKSGNSVTTGLEDTGFGWQTLSAVTTGSYNTAVGVNSMGALTTGSTNTSLGNDAMRNSVTVGSNVAIGKDALRAPTDTASLNVAVGAGAMSGQASSTGASNVAVGYHAMSNSVWTTAASNVFIGDSAGNAVTSGSGNTAVGRNAGQGIVTTNDNTYFGQGVGNVATGAQNSVIGSQAFKGSQGGGGNVVAGYKTGNQITQGGQNVILGQQVASTTLTTGNRNILIGTAATCDTAASGTNDTVYICSSTTSTPWLTGSLVSASMTATFGGTLTSTGTLTNGAAVADTGFGYTQPSTGGTVTLAAGVYHQIIDPAGTLATLTVNMPAAPTNGQFVDVRFSQIVTALTVSGNGNSIAGNPTSAAVGSQFGCIYRTTNTTWYC